MWESYVITIILIIVLYIVGTWNLNFFEKKNIKYPRPIPFLGNLWPMFLGQHLAKLADNIYHIFPKEKYIGFFGYREPSIWIRDNQILKDITVKDYESFLDHRILFLEEIDTIFANILISLRGKKWKDMRNIMSPAFTSSKIRSMLPFVAECSQQLVEYLNSQFGENNQKDVKVLEVETKDLLSRFAGDVIASTAFGLQINSHKDRKNEFYMMGMRVTDTDMIFYIKIMLFNILPISLLKLLNIRMMDQKMTNFFRSSIHDTMEEREKMGIKRLDMIHLLAESKKGSLSGAETQALPDDKYDLKYEKSTKKKNWTDDELTAQGLTFFLAGFESISTLLCFVLYELATNPDVQNKLVQEIDEVAKNGELQYDTIMTMKYIDMVVSEGLRLYPTLPGADRICTKPYTLPSPNDESEEGVKVNVGDAIFIPIRSIQRDPRYFANPEKFDPERFSEENRNSIKPFTFIPFGVGPRQCIGRRFAMMELKTALYYLLLNFRVLPCDKTENPQGKPTKILSMVPIRGIWIGFQKRNA